MEGCRVADELAPTVGPADPPGAFLPLLGLRVVPCRLALAAVQPVPSMLFQSVCFALAFSSTIFLHFFSKLISGLLSVNPPQVRFGSLVLLGCLPQSPARLLQPSGLRADPCKGSEWSRAPWFQHEGGHGVVPLGEPLARVADDDFPRYLWVPPSDHVTEDAGSPLFLLR